MCTLELGRISFASEALCEETLVVKEEEQMKSWNTSSSAREKNDWTPKPPKKDTHVDKTTHCGHVKTRPPTHVPTFQSRFGKRHFRCDNDFSSFPSTQQADE